MVYAHMKQGEVVVLIRAHVDSAKSGSIRGSSWSLRSFFDSLARVSAFTMSLAATRYRFELFLLCGGKLPSG